jgi:hypothetical protein
MKANELVLLLIQLAAPIAAFAFGIVPMGIFLSIWCIVFAIAEVTSKLTTGKTLSQHVWAKPMILRIILSAIMIAGMIALGYHFIWGGGQ